MSKKNITVAGAGVIGLWQALTLARAGHPVRLIEASSLPFAQSASRLAGALIAPECEAEAAPALVRDLGRKSLSAWRTAITGIVEKGTLVVAAARDVSELTRFERATERHERLDDRAIASLEPELAGRFAAGLFYRSEAHFNAVQALEQLLTSCRSAGVDVAFGQPLEAPVNGIVIDCRGMGARAALKTLRGVRGERLIVSSRDVHLERAVRLLHPRQPIYVVPQGGGRYVIGATVIEREDEGAVAVRSALELLGSAYALHPAFAEAEIVELGAGVRPAFPDNIPRIVIEGDGETVRVNGAYRHGFLLAPILAEAVADFIATGQRSHPLIA